MREWINTFVAVLGLVVMLWGVMQVSEINVSLKNLTAESISANEIEANQISVAVIENVSNITFDSGGAIVSRN